MRELLEPQAALAAERQQRWAALQAQFGALPGPAALGGGARPHPFAMPPHAAVPFALPGWLPWEAPHPWLADHLPHLPPHLAPHAPLLQDADAPHRRRRHEG